MNTIAIMCLNTLIVRTLSFIISKKEPALEDNANIYFLVFVFN